MFTYQDPFIGHCIQATFGQEYALNIPGIHLYFHSEQDTGYPVVVIEELNQSRYGLSTFQNISAMIREQLKSFSCNVYHFLYVVVTEDTDYAKSLISNDCSLWIIRPNSKKLMVFEQENIFFSPARPHLENLLESRTNIAAKSNTISELKHYVTPCNFTIIVMNLIIFLLTDLLPFTPDDSKLLNIGELSWKAVFLHGEYYRLITCMFLHYGISHISNNMVVLFVIGNYLERFVGKAKYLLIYLGSGILAGCASIVYNMLQNNSTVSVGASGAIFGVMGALLAFVLLNKGQLEGLGTRQILFMVAFSFYGGFTSQGVDNAAHTGGFVAGFLIATLLFLFQKLKKGRSNTHA